MLEEMLPQPEQFEPHQLKDAKDIFQQIIEYYEPTQNENGYKRVSLVRFTYEYAPSQDRFLYQFFKFITEESTFIDALSHFTNFRDWDIGRKNELALHTAHFADFLVENFFLPLKASAKKTPQFTPLSKLSLPEKDVAETKNRLNGLRKQCLIRDRHRCVITRKFDLSEALNRDKHEGANAKDDDDHLLHMETDDPVTLQVAHILPHSLMSSDGQKEAKRGARAILNMFDYGVIHLIDGVDIDQPINALTLTVDLHILFGDFQIYFQPTFDAQTSPTYTISLTKPVPFLHRFPVTRTLCESPNREIDLPSPRLLAIHRAIALILHLSGAGEYIDDILKDIEEPMVKSDGTTELGRLVSLRLGGWWDGIQAY